MKIDIPPMATIDDAAETMIAIAETLRGPVEAEFNAVMLRASVGMGVRDIHNQYVRGLNAQGLNQA